jgi:hypothetical protein
MLTSELLSELPPMAKILPEATAIPKPPRPVGSAVRLFHEDAVSVSAPLVGWKGIADRIMPIARSVINAWVCLLAAEASSFRLVIRRFILILLKVICLFN